MLRSYILAARPKTLPAAVVPVWVGCVLAWHIAGEIDWVLAGCTLAGALCIQVATNLFNDAIDAGKGADTENRLGPVRATASGLLSPRAVLRGAYLFLGLAVAFGWPLVAARGGVIVVIGLVSMYLSYGYTGGPMPLAYKGLGEIFVILFFGLVAVGGTVYVQLGLWPWESIVLGLQVGLLSAVLISINNIRDVDEDAVSGKRTLAVRFGTDFARWLLGLMVLGFFLLSATGSAMGLRWYFASVAPLFIGGLVLLRAIWRTEPGRKYNLYLAMAALLLVAFGGVFTAVVVG